jgi:hypothetical protein
MYFSRKNGKHIILQKLSVIGSSRSSTGAEIEVREENSTRNSSDAFFIGSWVLEKAEDSRVTYLRISSEFLQSIKPRSLQKTELSYLQNFLEIKTHHSKATQAQRRTVLMSLYSLGLRTRYLPANPGFGGGVGSEETSRAFLFFIYNPTQSLALLGGIKSDGGHI